MKICKFLDIANVTYNAEVSSKNEAINFLIDNLKGDSRIKDLEKVREAVLEREKIMSTGIGKGFAIPHAKTNGVNSFIASFARLKNPIDFDAHDGEPVEMMFLIIAKENKVSEHIRLLSRISRMMNDNEFRTNLLKAKSSEELHKLICETESALDS